MSTCNICNKKTRSGNSVSHSHKKTKRKFLPNIQTKKILQDGKIKKVRVCTSCLKKIKV